MKTLAAALSCMAVGAVCGTGGEALRPVDAARGPTHAAAASVTGSVASSFGARSIDGRVELRPGGVAREAELGAAAAAAAAAGIGRGGSEASEPEKRHGVEIDARSAPEKARIVGKPDEGAAPPRVEAEAAPEKANESARDKERAGGIRSSRNQLSRNPQDLTRYLDLPCVQGVPERLEIAEKLLTVISGTPNYPQLTLNGVDEFFSNYTASYENFTLFVQGIGTYKGVPDVAEYNVLARAEVNENFLSYDRREILSIECSNKTGRALDTLSLTFNEEGRVNYGLEDFEFVDFNIVTFAPDSHLMVNYYARLHPTLIDKVTGVGLISPKELCNEGALRCPGSLFPYESLRQCYEVVSSLPATCLPDGKPCYDCIEENSTLQGDTLQCRSLHMLSAKIRPTYHCKHLADVSERCFAAQCPMSAERLSPEKVNELLQPFDSSLPDWLRFVELVIATLAVVFPLFTYIKYRKFRSSAFTNEAGEADSDSDEMQNLADTSARITSGDNAVKNFPYMKCALRLLRKKGDGEDDDENLLLSAKGIDIGGCKLTAISGPSGCGKSTLMKLLCNIPQSHMDLELEVKSSPCNVAYTPQSSEMWPRNMTVRDILVFACVMHGCDVADYSECVKVLQIRDLLDQSFKTLSGGQQQRVHLLASMIRAEPCLLFMDEPLASLDEENACACLELLRTLPVDHAFVIAIHQMGPKVQEYFDRVLKIDPATKIITKYHMSIDSTKTTESVRGEASEGEIAAHSPSQMHHAGCIKSLIYLWHSIFFGWPVLEIGASVLGILIACIFSAMGNQSFENSSDEGYIPTTAAALIPTIVLQVLSSLACTCAFVVALVYSNEERKVIGHFITQRDIHPAHALVFNFLRFGAFGVLLATLMQVIPLWIMDLVSDGTDTVVINGAIFALAFSFLCYVLCLTVRPLYAPHVLLLAFLPLPILSGVFFPLSDLSGFFTALHYMNPMFYCVQANAHLVLGTFDAKCGSTDYPYLKCASSDILAEISGLEDIGSGTTQLFSAGVVLLAGLILMILFHKRSVVRGLDTTKTLSRHGSVRLPMRQDSIRSTRQMRQGSQTWLATSQKSMRTLRGPMGSSKPSLGVMNPSVIMEENSGSDECDEEQQIS